MDNNIEAVELAKAYRLVNHGPTVLVSARSQGIDNVMAAAWCCSLDFSPPKLTIVLDKMTKTRELIEQSGMFVIQVPTVAQLQLTHQVGNQSLVDDAYKLRSCGVNLFEVDDYDLPFVAGCSAWLACKLIPEPHNQLQYDLFIAEIVGAWSDPQVFSNGHWHFDTAPADKRSLHYIAGGQFYAIGDSLNAD